MAPWQRRLSKAAHVDYMSDPAFASIRAVYLAEHGDHWWFNDHLYNSFNSECNALRLQPRRPLTRLAAKQANVMPL